jgi:hypothetical protein
MSWQVHDAESELKHKLRPINAFRQAPRFDYTQMAPREELHQFLIWLYGEHMVPATFHSYNLVLRRPDLITGHTPDGNPIFIIKGSMLDAVWNRLRARMISITSSKSTVQVACYQSVLL